MRIFISYASEQRPIADRLCHALRNDGHTVFFDGDQLERGEAYDGEIRRQIQASHLFVFLISPDSVAAGYSLSELTIFQQSAPVPGKRLLPIMAVPTELEALPGYLRSVTILKPAGDLVADTVSQTARIAAWRAHRRMLAITAALAVVLIAAGVVWRFKYSADASPQRITLLKSLSLFHEPDQSSEIVAQLKPGDEFTLTKAPFNPNWVAVEANGVKAWAMTQDLVYQQIGGPGTIALGAGLGYEGSYWKLFFTTPRKEGQPPNKFGIDARFADAIGRTTKSLDIAVFEFNNPTVENAMVEAQRRGVKVRVVTGKLGYEEKNNRFPALEKAGLPIVVRPDSGLMHNKFAILDGAQVWTGSWNYTDGATYRNNENALSLEGQDIAVHYQKVFNQMFEANLFGRKRPASGSVAPLSHGILAMFSPEDPIAEELLKRLSSARKSVTFLAFAITHPEVIDSLLARSQTLPVRGIIERKLARSSGTRKLICGNGSKIQLRLGVSPGNLHHDVMVLDDALVITGSTNFSRAAFEKNDENIVFIPDAQLAAKYMAEFSRLWSKAQVPPGDLCKEPTPTDDEER